MKNLGKSGKVYYSSDDCLYVIEKEATWWKVMLLGLTISILVVGFYFLLGAKSTSSSIMHSNSKGEVEEKLGVLSRKIEMLVKEDSLLRADLNISEETHVMDVGGSRSSYLYEGSDKNTFLVNANELLRQADFLERSYKTMLDHHARDEKYYASIPTIKPCDGRYSSVFGMRLHPIYKRMLHHSGVDFPLASGSAVYSTGDGVVQTVGRVGGYGNIVVIDHGYGYKTIYAHLSKFKVKRKQYVKKGQVVAESGSTGISEAPHLHYEVVFEGKKRDPLDYFFDDDRLEKLISSN